MWGRTMINEITYPVNLHPLKRDLAKVRKELDTARATVAKLQADVDKAQQEIGKLKNDRNKTP